jgi:3-deoxy-manno-octulosonate cytidylyltransferase (CMP-KDO synthetase)
MFLNALDFFRIDQNSVDNLYHHVGIYAFTSKALIRYVSLKRSKLELERKLEQLRALENNMSIHVGYIKSSPLSVDTEEDLIEVKNLMKKNEKN